MTKFSDQEVQFKKRARRRLIGAVALVLLAVAILPFVLDNEPQPVNENISIQIPARDAAPFNSKVEPAPLPPAPAETAPPETKTPAAAAPAETPVPEAKTPPLAPDVKEPASTESPKVEEPRADVLAKAKPEGGAEADDKPRDQFVVQLGAYSNPANAKQAQTKLKSAGIKSYTETVQSGEGKTIRVRAGPFSSREQAMKVREKLKAMGYDGIVASK